MDSSINNRVPLVFVFFMLLYGVIIINLYRIQIHQHNFFSQLGKKQYHKQIIKQAPRAAIYDRAGNVLALNKEGLSAFINPKHVQHMAEIKEFLNYHFPDAYKRLLTHETDNFMYIKRRLTANEEQLLCTSGYTDIKLLAQPSRFYPVASTGPIVGLTDVDNQGLFGIECMYNKQLIGTPTISVLEKDARSGNFYFTKQLTQQGEHGIPITLTLDSNLQFLVYEELKKSIDHFNAASGAALVMNPDNGELLAMVTIPDFDPHALRIESIETTKNRAISDAYELGSVMKVFTALAALEEQVVTLDELIDCKSTTRCSLDGRTVNTVPGTQRGIVPFHEVVAASNNIGIAIIAKRLNTKLYDHYRRLGFGSKTTIELPGEQSGYITPPDKWSKQSIISLSYGYEIAATLIQLARAFGIIAHNGYPVQPTIILNSSPVEKQEPPLYSPESIASINEILERTTRTGTAKKAAIKGYKVRSKTGTANMVINGAYDTTKNIYTCAGIVKKNSYQRVIITCIQQAQGTNLYASTVAAPLFEKVAEKTLIHDKIV